MSLIIQPPTSAEARIGSWTAYPSCIATRFGACNYHETRRKIEALVRVARPKSHERQDSTRALGRWLIVALSGVTAHLRHELLFGVGKLKKGLFQPQAPLASLFVVSLLGQCGA